jgi:hypothetical protein
MRISIPSHVYSRSGTRTVVVLSMQNMRTTVLDDVASVLWRKLEDCPNQECAVEELLSAYAPRGGAAADMAAQRVKQLAQERLLEIKE